MIKVWLFFMLFIILIIGDIMKKKKEVKIITKTRIISLVLILLAFLLPINNLFKLLILTFTLILLTIEKRGTTFVQIIFLPLLNSNAIILGEEYW